MRGGIASLIGHLDTFPADLVVDYLFYLFGRSVFAGVNRRPRAPIARGLSRP